jgi:simple sugar transport system permease protein
VSVRAVRLRGLSSNILLFRELGVVVAGVAIAAIFTTTSSYFLTASTVGPMLTAATQFGVVGVGVALLMIAGEFDLSVGAVYAITPLIMALLSVNHHQNLWLSLGVAMLVAAGMGLLNGLATLFLGLPSFIVTLATGLFWTGVSLNLTGGYPISYFGHANLLHWLGSTVIGTNAQLSVSVFWFIGIGLILTFALRKTRFGNWVFASGGDRLAARAMGVPVGRVKILCFVIASTLAGFTGILEFASFGSVQPTGGSDLNLTAIVVAVVGGTAITGGRGSIFGAMLAAVVLGMTNTGLVLSGVSSTWFQAFVGFVLMFAVVINLRTEIFKTRFGVIK